MTGIFTSIKGFFDKLLTRDSTNRPSRKRRFFLTGDNEDLPPYEYKMPKISNEFLKEMNTEERTINLLQEKQSCSKMIQQREPHVSLIFGKRGKDKKENKSADTDDVMVLPGPSGFVRSSRGSTSQKHQLQRKQSQDDVQVVKEIVRSPKAKQAAFEQAGEAKRVIRPLWPLVQHSRQSHKEVSVVPSSSQSTRTKLSEHTEMTRLTQTFKSGRVPLQSMQSQDDVQVVREVPLHHIDSQVAHRNTAQLPMVSKLLQQRVYKPPAQRFRAIQQADVAPPRHRETLVSKVKARNIFKRNSPGLLKSALFTSYCLEDKRKYSEFLKSYVKTMQAPVAYARSSLEESGSPLPLIPWSTPRRSRHEKIELVDLTLPEESLERSVARIDVTKAQVASPFIKALQVRGTQESELVEIEVPKVQPVNSLLQVLQTKPAFHDEFLHQLLEKARIEKEIRQKEWDKTQMRLALLEKKSQEVFEEQYLERIRKQISYFDISKEEGEEEEEEEEVLPPLSEEADALVSRALMPKPPQEVLVSAFNKEITRRDIATLSGLNWLNDEVINFYMDLLMERGKLENYPSVYAMNTFFYPKLRQMGHSALKRWTKKVDIFSYEMIVVPVHLGMHWCMALLDIKNKTVSYYDSMGGPDHGCLQALLKYLEDESKDKKGQLYDTSAWTKVTPSDIPQQMNGSDCGMFSCMFAETLTRRGKINFEQAHMPYFRRRMVYEILTKKLMT